MNDNKTLKDIIIEETEQELASNLPEFSASPEEMLAKAKAKEKKAKRRRLGYFVFAAVLLLAFVAIGMKCSDTFLTVDADKNGKEEIVTDDGVIIEDEGWGSSSEDGITITEWKEVPLAKVHVEELLIPEYIPEGYEFEELKIESLEGNITCVYTYKKGDYKIEIREYINCEGLESIEVNDAIEIVDTTKGNMYIKKYDEYKIATIYDDGITIEINSALENKGLIKIIDNMN